MNELLSVLFYIYLFAHIKILLDSINMCSNNIFAIFSDFTTLFLFKFDDIKILTTLIFGDCWDVRLDFVRQFKSNKSCLMTFKRWDVRLRFSSTNST
jgi:hypothetical protein